MSAASQAVDGAPRNRAAEREKKLAEIAEVEAKAAEYRTKAGQHRRKGNQVRAEYYEGKADQQDRLAKRLRRELATDRRREASERAKQVKQTVARAKDEPGPVGQQAGQAKPTGQRRGRKVSQEQLDRIREDSQRRWNAMVAREEERYAKGQQTIPASQPTMRAIPATTEGQPMANGSGDAVNIEQTRALLDGWRDQAQGLRDSIDQGSASLDSRGLQQLGGILAKNDDNLATFISGLDEFDGQLAGHEEIAEKGHALGEMGDAEFYGVG